MRGIKPILWYKNIILYVATCVFLVFTFAYLTADFASRITLSPFLSIARDLTLSFYPNIALIFFTFLFTILFYRPIRDAERETEVDQLLVKFEQRFLPRLYDIAMHRHNMATSIEQSGIVEVITEHADTLIRKRIMRSKSRVCILDTWFLHDLIKQEEIFDQVNIHTAFFKILLLDPETDIAKQRSRDLDFEEQDVPNLIKSNTKAIKIFCQKFQIKNVELRYFKCLPSLQIYICDNEALVGFFFHHIASLAGPQLDVVVRDKQEEYTVLGKRLELEFETLWKKATPITMS